MEVDRQGKRSEKKQERDLQYSAQKFLDEMKTKNISVEIVKGSIEKETIKVAEKFNPQLIIVGREQKQKGLLGMPVKKLKKKMAEKCNYPILFLN